MSRFSAMQHNSCARAPTGSMLKKALKRCAYMDMAQAATISA